MPRLFSVELEGYRDVKGRFAKATTEVTKARRDEMRAMGQRVIKVLKEEAPVKTGRLRKGLRFNTREAGRELTMRLTSEAPYTMIVIRGRGPVVAKNARALRFVINGTVIFRKRVGPAKANPFVARAMRRLGGEPTDTARKISRRIENAYTAI